MDKLPKDLSPQELAAWLNERIDDGTLMDNLKMRNSRGGTRARNRRGPGWRRRVCAAAVRSRRGHGVSRRQRSDVGHDGRLSW